MLIINPSSPCHFSLRFHFFSSFNKICFFI
uniref:Uncharacterized protein n=1 Tax=Arundo donax TaxID=35708 RepID=A0A0A8YBP1_ARUDO